MAHEDDKTIRQKMDALETEKTEKASREIRDTETIIGVRRIRGLVHLWLLDSRTSTARRVEYSVGDFTLESLTAVELAFEELKLRQIEMAV